MSSTIICPIRLSLLTALMLILAITAFPSQLYAQKSGEPKRDAPKGKESSNQLVSQRVGTLNMDTLEYSLNLIKSDYETSLLSLKDPKMIQALSLKETDLALFMTVAVLDPTTYGNYYADRSGLLERLWANGKMSLEIKEIYTLVLYSEALSRLVVIIAGKEDNQEVLSEFVNVTKESAIGKAKSQPAKIAEARVYWSNRIVIMTSLLIKVLSPEKYQNLEDIMDDLLNRAEVIATRRDVHYQARMDLLYLNNVQSISSMLFLLAKDSGSAIGESAEAMEDRWEERIADSDFQVSEKTSLSLVSNAQLCFPLFHSIATGKYMKHGPQKF